MRTQRHLRWRRLVSAAAGFVLALTIAEAAATHFLPGLRPSTAAAGPDGRPNCGEVFAFDADTGWWGKPDLDCVMPHEGDWIGVRTNRAGLRVERNERVTPDGVLRVGVFGDSFTFGTGVRTEDTYGAQIDALVPGVDVLNFGLVAGGPDQSLLAFERKAPAFGLDAAVVAPLVENIDRILPAEDGEKPYFTLRAGRLQLHNHPVRVQPRATADETPIASRFALWQLTLAAVRPVALEMGVYRPYAVQYEGPAGELLEHILRGFREAAPGMPLLFAPLPTYHYIEYGLDDDYSAVFRRAASATGATYVDLLPAFRRLEPDARRAVRFRVDQHYTSLGHRVVANALAPHVAAIRDALRHD